MKYNELTITPQKKSKRLGRGISAGQGKTAGRGTKGQKARTGSKKKPGFSGGQNPLMQQLPKLPGFKSHRVPAEVVKLGQLEDIKVKVIDATVLAEHKLISNPFVRVKLLVGGDFKSAKTVRLPEASQTARDDLTKAGGSFEKVERLKRQSKKTEPAKKS
ncbi:MAG TPA: 50S ribosomal protein L15 [Candidatus Saccharimonadales bacterium]|jgi:large subunit ribosomal protein L15